MNPPTPEVVMHEMQQNFENLHSHACGCGKPRYWLCDCQDNAMLGYCCRRDDSLVLFTFKRRCAHVEALVGEGAA
jgi:hypothetical protein